MCPLRSKDEAVQALRDCHHAVENRCGGQLKAFVLTTCSLPPTPQLTMEVLSAFWLLTKHTYRMGLCKCSCIALGRVHLGLSDLPTLTASVASSESLDGRTPYELRTTSLPFPSARNWCRA